MTNPKVVAIKRMSQFKIVSILQVARVFFKCLFIFGMLKDFHNERKLSLVSWSWFQHKIPFKFLLLTLLKWKLKYEIFRNFHTTRIKFLVNKENCFPTILLCAFYCFCVSESFCKIFSKGIFDVIKIARESEILNIIQRRMMSLSFM